MPFELSTALPLDTLLILLIGVFLVAVLYSSVGHAGASGYIAVMSLLSFAPAVIKPSALALNVLVASIATWQFYRAGHFNWRLEGQIVLGHEPKLAVNQAAHGQPLTRNIDLLGH